MSTPLLHPSPHPFTCLPTHSSLDDTNNTTTSPSRPPLLEFLHSALSEAQVFLTSIPQTFHPSQKPRLSRPSSAPVQLSTYTNTNTPAHSETKPKSTNKGAFWVCRKSTHENASVPGSASWAEFRAGLRDNHAENEMEYTPSVSAVERLLAWPSQPEIEGGWRDVDMHVNVITHTFNPKFLISPRSFVVLTISADMPQTTGFVTVQIPLDGTSETSLPPAMRQRIKALVPPRAIFASYTSVEQVVLVQDRIEWSMATTSNAGGAIPQWVQRSWTMGGVPKAVVADVGLFIGWTERRRSQPAD